MDENGASATGLVGRLTAAAGKAAIGARSPGIALFLRNIGVTFVFKAGSLLLTLVVYVLCARALGAAVWGQAALIVSAANLVVIPLTFGLYNGVVRFVPVSNEEESREWMGTALAANLILSSALAVLLGLSGPIVERLIGFPVSSWLPAIAIAMSVNLYILTESFLRGQQRFYRLGLYKLLGSFVFLAGALLGLYGLGAKSMYSYLIPLAGQNLVFFIAVLLGGGLGRLRATMRTLRRLFLFGFFMMLSWLFSALLFTSDLFFVARFVPDDTLGVYSVYQNTIRGLCTVLFHDVFAVVFVPMIASLDKRRVDRILARYSIPIAACIALAAAAMTTALVLLYGEAYPLDWRYVGLTSCGIAMNMMYLLYTSVLALEGAKAARLTFLALLVPMPALLLMQYLLARQWGMTGGMVSVVALNACLLIAYRLAIRWFYRLPPAAEKGALSHR